MFLIFAPKTDVGIGEAVLAYTHNLCFAQK